MFGEVTEGMEHVDAIAKGEPLADPDKIISMRLEDYASQVDDFDFDLPESLML